MLINCQFIFVVIIFLFYNFLATQSKACDCEVLEVKSNGTIGNQKFTKQSVTINEKTLYFSMNKDVIYWNKTYWSYSIHLDEDFQKHFHEMQKYKMEYFSLENICKNRTWSGIIKTTAVLNTRCLRINNYCSEGPRSGNIQTKGGVLREVAISVTIENTARHRRFSLIYHLSDP